MQFHLKNFYPSKKCSTPMLVSKEKLDSSCKVFEVVGNKGEDDCMDARLQGRIDLCSRDSDHTGSCNYMTC